jgi:hypothetical protein
MTTPSIDHFKGKHTGLDNDRRPKSEYLQRLAGMDEKALAKECEQKIWLSAYANNNPRSDFHWHSDACWDECQHRGKPDIYERAFEKAKASA